MTEPSEVREKLVFMDQLALMLLHTLNVVRVEEMAKDNDAFCTNMPTTDNYCPSSVAPDGSVTQDLTHCAVVSRNYL